MKARHLGIIVACVMALAVVAPAQADLTIGMAQDTLAASVTFDVLGNNLIVTLKNVSTFDATRPEEILTGVYFNIDGLGTVRITVSEEDVERAEQVISSHKQENG